jgi:ribonuclease HII
MANFAIERRLKKSGFDIIIGVDEAGRGPLAGPVVAGAVCLKATRFKNRIDDSKKLTKNKREAAFSEIIQKSVFALSVIDEKAIDNLNILNATRLCMQEAIISLLRKLFVSQFNKSRTFLCNEVLWSSRKVRDKKICILVDGNIKLKISNYSVFSIIKGDEKSKTIASASILAKVSRDHIMSLYDKIWPQYGFLRHKGYPTSLHRLALRQFGPCPIHRLSFDYV